MNLKEFERNCQIVVVYKMFKNIYYGNYRSCFGPSTINEAYNICKKLVKCDKQLDYGSSFLINNNLWPITDALFIYKENFIFFEVEKDSKLVKLNVKVGSKRFNKTLHISELTLKNIEKLIINPPNEQEIEEKDPKFSNIDDLIKYLLDTLSEYELEIIEIGNIYDTVSIFSLYFFHLFDESLFKSLKLDCNRYEVSYFVIKKLQIKIAEILYKKLLSSADRFLFARFSNILNELIKQKVELADKYIEIYFKYAKKYACSYTEIRIALFVATYIEKYKIIAEQLLASKVDYLFGLNMGLTDDEYINLEIMRKDKRDKIDKQKISKVYGIWSNYVYDELIDELEKNLLKTRMQLEEFPRYLRKIVDFDQIFVINYNNLPYTSPMRIVLQDVYDLAISNISRARESISNLDEFEEYKRYKEKDLKQIEYLDGVDKTLALLWHEIRYQSSRKILNSYISKIKKENLDKKQQIKFNKLIDFVNDECLGKKFD